MGLYLSARSSIEILDEYNGEAGFFIKTFGLNTKRNKNGWRVSWDSIKKRIAGYAEKNLPGILYTKCTEAGCDLAAMAGCSPTSVICEIMKDDGSMARLPDLLEFAKEHQLKIGSIADLIQYRSQHESIVVREGTREFITPWGKFQGIIYRDTPSSCIHIALVHGKPSEAQETLVRVHEPVTVLDFLDSNVSTHSWPLAKALEQIAASPAGVAVLLNASGIAAPNDQDWLAQFQKLNQSQEEAKKPLARKTDFRSYGIGAQILKDIGVGKMRLLANPSPVPSLSGYKLEVTGYKPYTS